MIKQDLQSVNGYMLGIIGLVIALFIPFAALVLKIFKSNPLVGALFLSAFIPLLALALGVVGLIKSSKQSTSFTKSAKIINILSIVIGAVLLIFNLYTFIKSGGLNLI